MSTNSPLNAIFSEKQQTRRLLIILLLACFIVSCSTPKAVKKLPSPVTTPKEVTPSVATPLTGQDKLNQAQSLSKKAATTLFTDKALTSQTHILLIEASELFLQEKNYSKSLWLANKTSNLVSEAALIYRLLIVKAASLQALGYTDQAHSQLRLIDELISHTQNQDIANNVQLTLPYYQTLSKVFTTQENKPQALSAKLYAFAMNTQADNLEVESIWQQLITLAPWQVEQIAASNPPLFKGWQQLLFYAHKFGAKPEQLSRYITLWQKQYPTHPAHVIANNLLNKPLSLDTIENIAVLLPLTGAQAKAGLSAQQGILAAYRSQQAISLHFIDTNLVDWQNLPAQFNELTIDHVIGPLLKTHVEEYLALSVNHTELHIPTLLLNVSDQRLASFQTALSMRPESEAEQAASVLSQQNYQSPLILSYQDKTSKRIAQAFRAKWQQSTGNNIDIVYLSLGKHLQASLKESLDVQASQTRIEQLKGRLKHVIKAESRNRRDLDMIYLIGSASQTRLIKPYIDVNTSPFAKVIPVYASSRSHSYFNDLNHEDSASDLQNLTFTQMPWLLDAKQRNKSLAKLSQDLWPKRSDSLSRIFAMGFDSYHLLNKITLMQQAPYILHYGQTGTLQLDSNNVLNRSLTWGSYRQNKVMEVSID